MINLLFSPLLTLPLFLTRPCRTSRCTLALGPHRQGARFIADRPSQALPALRWAWMQRGTGEKPLGTWSVITVNSVAVTDILLKADQRSPELLSPNGLLCQLLRAGGADWFRVDGTWHFFQTSVPFTNQFTALITQTCCRHVKAQHSSVYHVWVFLCAFSHDLFFILLLSLALANGPLSLQKTPRLAWFP